MKSTFITILCLNFSVNLFCQSLDKLVDEIDHSEKTFKQVLKILGKFSITKKAYAYDTSDSWDRELYFAEYAPDLKTKVIKKGVLDFYTYSEKVFYWKRIDSFPARIAASAKVYVEYKDNTVASIIIVDDNNIHKERKIFWPDTCFRYFDSTFLQSEITNYNRQNNADFTLQNLLAKDKCKEFSIVPGCCGSNISSEMEPFLPLIQQENKTAMIRNCKSFNPVRRAFGAVCLYYLQRDGVLLSDEENYLIDKIRCSDDKISGSWGCFGFRNKKISDVLSDKEIEGYYITIKFYFEEMSKNNKESK